MTMRRDNSHVLRVLGLLLLLAPAAAAAGTLEAAKDIRVLIDISGSMKRNDPQNLRAPALRLLTGLLPGGARAGVWTYGRQVNMLVPHATVDAEWKERARLAAAKISSTGLNTNIEEALAKSTADWRAADAGAERHLIMLTDGLVDVSEDAALNAASRARIVDVLLPRLRDVKVKIHTIALSAEADHVLLRQLASATDGAYEQVDSADRLQRVFLHLFEKAARPDTLPLKDNVVRVDPSIQEMTFLVFRAAAATVELVTPGGKALAADRASASVRWHRDDGYDLVTITKPEAGDWQIRGTHDSDNRVTVVTDLKVRASSLPGNLAVDDLPYYFVQLTQQGTVIRQNDFLKLVNVSLQLGDEHGRQPPWPLLDDGKTPDVAGGDGTFSSRMPALGEGRHELILVVDGTTFRREQRQTINVYAQPAAAMVQPGPSGGYVLAVVPHAGLIDPQTMQVSATITDPAGKVTEAALAQSGPAEWRLDFTTSDPAGPYTAEFHVQGMRPNGKPIDGKLDTIVFGADGVRVVADAAAPQPEPAAEPPATAAPTQAADHPAPATHAAGGEINWFSVAWQTLLINVVLGAAGFLVYKKWRRTQPPAIALSLKESAT